MREAHSFRYVRRMCLITCTAFLVAHSVAFAQPAKHEGVEEHLDSTTVFVGWLDITKVDLAETAEFMSAFGPAPNENDLAQIRVFQQALKGLEVTKIYLHSSFANMSQGIPSFIVPSRQPKSVKLLAETMLNGSGMTVVEEDNVVLIGAKALTETGGKAPNAALLKALRNTDTPHGMVAAIDSEMLRTAMQVLAAGGAQEADDLVAMVQTLPNIKSLSMGLEKMPPSKASLKIEASNAEKVESGVTTFLKSFAPDVLKTVSVSRKGSEIQLSTSDIAETLTVLETVSGAKQTSRMNDFKQVALSLHNYYSAYEHFPPQSLTSKDGKRLLSWRVLVLPFLEQQALYDQFHLDEPWDSPHNLKVASAIPPVYKMQGEQELDENGVPKTTLLAPLTKNSIFGKPGAPAEFRNVIDGTSNTIWLVEAGSSKSVPWTKPADLVIDTADPMTSIYGDEEPHDFIASMADGSVHMLKATLAKKVINALITMNGGEVIEHSELE